ncbi:MAG: response regulator transcription factor [Candidatus Dojkabacteria bacterium]
MKLLIIEDEERIANALKKGFCEEGFTVEVANEGETGQKLARTKEYNCIILDLMLPVISGLQLLRVIRERKVTTPVIILTAKGSVSEKIEGLEQGADDYLAKPFSFEELLARVRALIRRTTTSGTGILEVDTLVLDPKKQIVTRSGKEIQLSGREFKILEYLLMNKGAILSEQRIIDHIWSYNAGVSSNVVAAHIKNIRSKIDKAFSKEKKLLQTVRGLGYKIHE